MQIQDLLPRHKGDMERAEQLRDYSYEALKSIVLELLQWLQDLNWPVAKPVADCLIRFVDRITAELLVVLNDHADAVWKYGVIAVFGSIITDPLIQKEIWRIAVSPSQLERDEGLHQLANEIVRSDDWMKPQFKKHT